MSHGNTNKDNGSLMSQAKKSNVPPNESVIDRLNRGLARLMGKKSSQPNDSQPPSKIPSNNRFIGIIFIMLVILWGLTGVYYVPEGSYGLILQNGKLSKVVKGLQAGMTLPFPFSDVIALDATSSSIYFGKASESTPFQVITSDEHILDASGEVSYHLSNPQQYFMTYYQENSDLDLRVNWLTKTIVQDYFLHRNSSDLLRSGNIVSSNEIRNLADKILANYGIELDKFNLISLHDVTKSAASTTPNLASIESLPLNSQIIQEATNYSQARSLETESMVAEFNQFLPQYRSNNKMIAELMYYKMLSEIPAESSVSNYRLLALSLAQFSALSKNPLQDIASLTQTGTEDFRGVNRSTVRSVVRGRTGRPD